MPLMSNTILLSSMAANTCLNIDKNKPIIEGTYNQQGRACISVQISATDYINYIAEGVNKMWLLDVQEQPIRQLIEINRATAKQSSSFIVPTSGQYQLNLQGQAGKIWKIQFEFLPYLPLDIQGKEELSSPLLQQLAKSLLQEDSTETFWHRIEQIGSPLVEPHADHEKKVTFLWRGAQRNSYILGAPSGDHEPMSRLGDSDVWYRTFIVPDDTLLQYKLAPDIPEVAAGGFAQRRAILTTAQADPFNPQLIPYKKSDPYNYFSLLSLSPQSRKCHFEEIIDYEIKGKIDVFQYASEILCNQREITVYTPAMEMTEAAMLILLDGQTYRHGYLMDHFFDQWMTSGELPPMYVVFIDSISGEQRGKELPPNALFPQFLAEELLPSLKQKGYRASAQRTIIAGSSYGGLAATWNGLQHPELFANVLSMSGSYWWSPEGEESEWLLRKIAKEDKQPLRFYLQAGLFEKHGNAGGIINNHHHLSKVLEKKEYPFYKQQLPSGHDYISWCETLYEGTRKLSSYW